MHHNLLFYYSQLPYAHHTTPPTLWAHLGMALLAKLAKCVVLCWPMGLAGDLGTISLTG